MPTPDNNTSDQEQIEKLAEELEGRFFPSPTPEQIARFMHSRTKELEAKLAECELANTNFLIQKELYTSVSNTTILTLQANNEWFRELLELTKKYSLGCGLPNSWFISRDKALANKTPSTQM